MPQIFLSTPSARRATTYFAGLPREMPISIHALREEGDGRRPHDEHHGKISIHALREEGDVPGWDADLLEMLFLSTPSARRATPSCRA